MLNFHLRQIRNCWCIPLPDKALCCFLHLIGKFGTDLDESMAMLIALPEVFVDNVDNVDTIIHVTLSVNYF